MPTVQKRDYESTLTLISASLRNTRQGRNISLQTHFSLMQNANVQALTLKKFSERYLFHLTMLATKTSNFEILRGYGYLKKLKLTKY